MKKSGLILAVGGAAVLIFIGKKKRRKDMSKNLSREEVKGMNMTIDTGLSEKLKVTREKDGLNDAERKELTDRFKAMSADELELFMDLVPVELCINRIQKELDKAKAFESAIKAATDGLK